MGFLMNDFKEDDTEKVLSSSKMGIIGTIFFGVCSIVCLIGTISLCESGEFSDMFWIFPILGISFLIVTFIYLFIYLDSRLELLKREDRANVETQFKSSLKFWVVIIAVVVLITLLPYSCSSSGGNGKCTICGKKGTHNFQNSSYCDEHYEDAVKWSFDNLDN